MNPGSKSVRVAGFASLLAFAAFMSVSNVAGAAGAQNADLKAVSNYRLNDRALARYTAVVKSLVALQKQHPELAEQLKEDDASKNAGSIADVVAAIDRYPRLSGAITGAGMSVTDYVTCSYALIQAAIYALAAGNGDWSKVPAGIPTENVRYYLANKAKFEQLNELLNQLNSGSGGA